MTTEPSGERSPELLALQREYKILREARSAKSEPDNAGFSPEAFVELSENVADEYTPSAYLESAPPRK
jgi:hypothetical protein